MCQQKEDAVARSKMMHETNDEAKKVGGKQRQRPRQSSEGSGASSTFLTVILKHTLEK